MNFRVDEIEITPEFPFRNDVLDRTASVTFLAEIISKAKGPLVMAIDAPWGYGKTTFVRMLDALLTQRHYPCIYFNAWEIDYVTDPLVAIVSTLVESWPGNEDLSVSLRENVRKIRVITSLLAKRGVVGAVKFVSAGALDLDEEIEIVKREIESDPIKDIVDSYQKEVEVVEIFRNQLEIVLKSLSEIHEGKSIIFFIDELDRCRPTFAIELLERIKHLLNVPNIVFVLSIDKAQLEASTAAVYGNGINSSEYLRRFFDLEFGIPDPKGDAFVDSLVSKFGMESFFSQRTSGELAYDRRNFIEMFTKLASLTRLTLRAQERCIARLMVVLEQTAQNHYLDPILIAFLIVLRVKEPDRFRLLMRGDWTSDDCITYLKTLSGGGAMLDDRLGIVLESYLIWSDISHERFESKMRQFRAIQQGDSAGPGNRRRESQILEVVGSLSMGRTRGDIRSFARKVDIAANIRD